VTLAALVALLVLVHLADQLDRVGRRVVVAWTRRERRLAELMERLRRLT
jgi:hypothetical protein